MLILAQSSVNYKILWMLPPYTYVINGIILLISSLLLIPMQTVLYIRQQLTICPLQEQVHIVNGDGDM